MRTFKIAALAIGLSLSLTACDPPMPASLLVEIAEQTVQCESGDVSVAVPTAAQDLGTIWLDSMQTACAEMSFTQVGFDQPADILISAEASSLCQPFARVPFSIDAAVFAVYVADGASVNLDPASIAGILDGSITSWADATIAAVNPDLELPPTKIKLVPAASSSDISSLTAWLSTLGTEISTSAFTASSADAQETLGALEDGSIALVPYSESLLFGASIASIVVGPDVYADSVVPSLETISSAATQWVITKDEAEVSVELDPSIAPTPPEGSDEAPLPYQAIYPVEMNLCGSDSLLTRTVGRFFMRQDQQGVLASSTMVPITENLRLASIEIVAKGLPIPTATATEEPTE